MRIVSQYEETCKSHRYVFETVVSVFLKSSVWFAVWVPEFSLVSVSFRSSNQYSTEQLPNY